MIRNIKTEAIVLRKRSLLGKDILISFFTQEEGKIVTIAKGVKKITSRRSPHLQTGNLLSIQVNKKGDRFYLTGTNIISGFSELKRDQDKINILYQYFFVLEKILPEHQKEEAVYNLTKSFLVKLTQSKSNNNILILFLNKLLQKMGYAKQDYESIELESIISDLINEKIPSFNI